MSIKQLRTMANDQEEQSVATKRISGSIGELNLKVEIEYLFNAYDSNHDGVLEFVELERFLEDSKLKRYRESRKGENTIEDYLLVFMLSSEFKEDGQL